MDIIANVQIQRIPISNGTNNIFYLKLYMFNMKMKCYAMFYNEIYYQQYAFLFILFILGFLDDLFQYSVHRNTTYANNITNILWYFSV